MGPEISIILVTLNRASYLDKCLRSITREIDGCDRRAEVVVVDGGSTDGSVEVIRAHSKHLAYWVSEPDSGVSEAANKGAAVAQGEFLRFVGADDEIIQGSTSPMLDKLAAMPDVGILLGHGEFFVERAGAGAVPTAIMQPVGRVAFGDLLRIEEIGWPSPEVSFTRREVFHRIGGFDRSYHYLAYLDFWLRATRAGVVLEVLPDKVTRRYLTPTSDTIAGGAERIEREMRRLLWQHGGLPWIVGAKEFRTRGVLEGSSRAAARACRILGIHPRARLRSILRTMSEFTGSNPDGR